MRLALAFVAVESVQTYSVVLAKVLLVAADVGHNEVLGPVFPVEHFEIDGIGQHDQVSDCGRLLDGLASIARVLFRTFAFEAKRFGHAFSVVEARVDGRASKNEPS